jgi:glutamate-1-semialdehyde 2,1-aminomutase
MKTYTYPQSRKWFQRAAKSIPCGIYGHFSPAPLVPPSAYPFFVDRAEGARFVDIDGNEFIDYMCAYGPMVLGYNRPEVEEAVRKQAEKVNCGPTPGKPMVELAEYLVDLVQGMDWAYFAKNGNDVTTYALMVARAATGRKKVIKVAGGYHGVAPWTQGGDHAGIIPEDVSNILTVEWNNLGALTALVQQHKGEIAGFIATPYHHPTFVDNELPAGGYWKSVETLCRKEGIVLIIDDVRCGFRLDLRGSHAYFGFQPDLVCFCKAIANGHPISALMGSGALKTPASKVFYTGSYWFSAAPMAAALATLKLLKKIDGPAKMQRTGKELCDGLVDLAEKHGFKLKVTGVPSMPYLRLTDDDSLMLHQRWCAECTRRGAYFTSHHNWFLSTAHSREDILRTLAIADEAFAVLRKQL